MNSLPINLSTTGLGLLTLTASSQSVAPAAAVTTPSPTISLGLPPRDFVQTVNTMTRTEMQDRGAVSLNQAIEQITGVRPVSGVYASSDVTSGIRSRGFENRFSFLNGLRFHGFNVRASLSFKF